MEKDGGGAIIVSQSFNKFDSSLMNKWVRSVVDKYKFTYILNSPSWILPEFDSSLDHYYLTTIVNVGSRQLELLLGLPGQQKQLLPGPKGGDPDLLELLVGQGGEGL